MKCDKLTTKFTKPRHILLSKNLCVLEAWPQSCHIGIFQSSFERIEDEAVRSVAYRMDVLYDQGCQHTLNIASFSKREQKYEYAPLAIRPSKTAVLRRSALLARYA